MTGAPDEAERIVKQVDRRIGIAADTTGTRLFTSGADGRLHAFGCN